MGRDESHFDTAFILRDGVIKTVSTEHNVSMDRRRAEGRNEALYLALYPVLYLALYPVLYLFFFFSFFFFLLMIAYIALFSALLSIVQELCESRGGRPELSVLTSLLASVDVKIY